MNKIEIQKELQQNTEQQNPKEIFTPDDAPSIMKQTAEYLLMKTNRNGLTCEELTALREPEKSHYPARVQQEIDKAVKRFVRKERNLKTLTFMYIAESMKYQASRKKIIASENSDMQSNFSKPEQEKINAKYLTQSEINKHEQTAKDYSEQELDEILAKMRENRENRNSQNSF